MKNDSVDAVLVRRIKDCVADKHLSSDFSDRLVSAIRRRRRLRRIKVVALIVVLTMICGLFGYFSAEKPANRSTEATLVSTDGPTKEAQASGWMLLGFFRECLKRSKSGKRKEEE